MSDALNSLLPEYEFKEHHTTVVLGTPEQVFASVEDLSLIHI